MDNVSQSSGNEFYRTAVWTIVGFIILSCILVFGISEIRSIAFECCLKNYGRKIRVQADTLSITKKLYEMINPKLSTDMTIEEVHKAFNEVVQTEFHMEGLTLDGGSQEIAMLHICRTISLDTILVDFSKDGFIVEAKLYFGD